MLVDKIATKAILGASCQPTDVSRRTLLRSAATIASGAVVLAAAITATHAEAEFQQDDASCGFLPDQSQKRPTLRQLCLFQSTFVVPTRRRHD